MLLDPSNETRVEDGYVLGLLYDLKRALKYKFGVEDSTSVRVEFLKGDVTQSVFVADVLNDNDVKAKLLPAREGLQVGRQLEPVFLWPEDDGVLNAGDGLDVDLGSDALVNLLHLFQVDGIRLGESGHDGLLVRDLGQEAARLRARLRDLIGECGVPFCDLCSQVYDVESDRDYGREE